MLPLTRVHFSKATESARVTAALLQEPLLTRVVLAHLY